jgi:hypothetical protein
MAIMPLVIERRLLGLLFPLSLAQSHSWTAAILVDEFDACFFKGSSDLLSRRFSAA